MAKIKALKFLFDPPQAQDVVALRVYFKPNDGAPIDANTQNVDIDAQNFIDNPDGRKYIEISSITPLQGQDGDFLFGFTFIDDVGNESDRWEGVQQVDFIAPAAPTNCEFLLS